ARAPERELALVGAASQAEALGQREAALGYWRRAGAANPWSPGYRQSLVLLLVKQEAWPEARKECEAGLRGEPPSAEGRPAPGGGGARGRAGRGGPAWGRGATGRRGGRGARASRRWPRRTSGSCEFASSGSSGEAKGLIEAREKGPARGGKERPVLSTQYTVL